MSSSFSDSRHSTTRCPLNEACGLVVAVVFVGVGAGPVAADRRTAERIARPGKGPGRSHHVGSALLAGPGSCPASCTQPAAPSAAALGWVALRPASVCRITEDGDQQGTCHMSDRMGVEPLLPRNRPGTADRPGSQRSGGERFPGRSRKTMCARRGPHSRESWACVRYLR